MEIPKKIFSLLKKKNADAKKTNLNYDLALASSHVGLWNWDIQADKVTADNQLYDLLGLSVKDAACTYKDFLELTHPEDRERVENAIQSAIENKTEFQVEFRVIHADKSIHYLESRGGVHYHGGKPLLMTGVTCDMTSHHLAEEDLKKAKEIAEEASRSKTGFMARISHDLRSPLNGIIGFAELMYHGKVGSISSEHKEYLGDILMSARQLLILINDVVDLAKVESGKMEFHPEKINLQKILDETESIFQHMIKEKNINFEIIVDPNLTAMVIDPTRLKQVIYNYVSNALKCTQDNGVVKIQVTPNDKKTFRLSVIDNGIGIKENDLQRLFIEFQQIDPTIAKKYSGTGLGLALAKHIVEAQGGHVGVSSEYGKGSEFYVTLPYLN